MRTEEPWSCRATRVRARPCRRPAAVAMCAALLWQWTAGRADEPLASQAKEPRAPAAKLLLAAEPLGASTLADERGGAQLSSANLTGVVAGNGAYNTVTGNNTISTGAFANASGLPVVIQNSGNNVLIQNSTIVNVQVK